MKRTMILFAFATLALCAWPKKQLNITILLDLSERLDTGKYHPDQYLEDIEAVKSIVEEFKAYNKLDAKTGFLFVKGKIQVLAEPSDAVMNKLLKPMRIDLKGKPPEKKAALAKMDSTYDSCLHAIYQHAIETGRADKWPGSDIYGFFEPQAGGRPAKIIQDSCIRDTAVYRNILIILTDGYIWHKDNKHQQGNRYTYLLSDNIDTYRQVVRSSKTGGLNALQTKIDKDNFGLIVPTGSNLSNLEVRVLEINHEKKAYPEDRMILEEVICKWFKEMKVDVADSTKWQIREAMSKPVK